jgi:pilus assembly protein CpaB
VALPGVLTIATALPPGHILRPADFIEVRWAGDTTPVGAIIAGTPQAGQLGGAVTRRAFAAGELVVAGSFILPGERGFLAAIITPGNRAIAVRVDANSAAGGLIWPGDHVDVILTQKFTDDDIPLAQRVLSETILSNVRILSTDQKMSTAGGDTTTVDGKLEPVHVPTTVTVEVTPAQAELVSVGATLGELALTLRGVASDPLAASPVVQAGATWAGGVSPRLAAIRRKPRADLSAQPIAPPSQFQPIDRRPASVKIFRGSQGAT